MTQPRYLEEGGREGVKVLTVGQNTDPFTCSVNKKLCTLALKQLFDSLSNKQHYPSANQRNDPREMFGEHEKSL